MCHQYIHYRFHSVSTRYYTSLFSIVFIAGIVMAGFITSIIKFLSVHYSIVDTFKYMLLIDKIIIDITIITLHTIKFGIALSVLLFANMVCNVYDQCITYHINGVQAITFNAHNNERIRNKINCGNIYHIMSQFDCVS